MARNMGPMSRKMAESGLKDYIEELSIDKYSEECDSSFLCKVFMQYFAKSTC